MASVLINRFGETTLAIDFWIRRAQVDLARFEAVWRFVILCVLLEAAEEEAHRLAPPVARKPPAAAARSLATISTYEHLSPA